MPYVHPTTQPLKSCFQAHFSLPYFQREYKWEIRHFLELLNDIQGAFLESLDTEKGRKGVADYAPYFLGSIITAALKDGKKPLIDGQQRLTSIFLIMAFLQKLNSGAGQQTINLMQYIGSSNFGETTYSIEFGAKRKEIFDKFLDTTKDLDQSLTAISELEGLSDSDQKVVDALRSLPESLHETAKENILFFIDCFMERVLLIDISVETESEAHRVFVTMNDRGLRLSAIDLLKGQLLSKIHDPEDSRDCHRKWVENIAELKKFDPEEDSLFIRAFMRAKWANTVRGKAKGDLPGDFDKIGEAYHRWFSDKTEDLGLKNSDDYVRFIRDEIVRHVEIYKFIKDAESSMTPGFESVYFNAIRRFSPQAMVIMAATATNDAPSVWKEKIKLLSRYIDLILTTRTIQGKANNYDNFKESAFSITKAVRGKTVDQVRQHIVDDWGTHFSAIDQLPNVTYRYSDRSDLLFVLARISCFLEESFSADGRSNFPTYWARDKGAKTFDIEHILPDAYTAANFAGTSSFDSEADYKMQRNRIGGLILLPRSRNRSLQDKGYAEKIVAYATENPLAQSLCEPLYKSNPKVVSFQAANTDIPLAHSLTFGKAEIEARGALYTAIAKKIWAAPLIPVVEAKVDDAGK